MKLNRKKGVVIEAVVAIAIVITSSVIVVNLLSSSFDESKTYDNLNKAKESMSFIDSVIRELAVEAPGARRTINILSDFGTFSVDGESDSIKFFMESPVSIIESGTSVQEGNLIMTSGPTMSAYERDVDNDGITDLVLENEAVLFAMKKIGSPSNITSINTTSIFTMIRNKRANVNITPITYIYVDDMLNTSTGNGFTELSEKGTSIQSASIRVYVNSSGTKEYDAVFTLRSAQDFAELEIKNIKDK